MESLMGMYVKLTRFRGNLTVNELKVMISEQS